MHITTILWYKSAHNGIQTETHLFTYLVWQRVQNVTALLMCCHCSSAVLTFWMKTVWWLLQESPASTSELSCDNLLANFGRNLAPTACGRYEWDCLQTPVQPLVGKLGYSSSLQGEDLTYCMGWKSLPVFVPVWLRTGEQGVKVLPYIVLHVVKGRRAIRSTVLNPRATALLNPRGKKI